MRKKVEGQLQFDFMKEPDRPGIGGEVIEVVFSKPYSPKKATVTKWDIPKIVAQLKKAAESCMKQAEGINTEISGNWTHRRQRFADSANIKKDNLIRRANILNKLSNLWLKDECPAILMHIRSNGDLDFIKYDGFPPPPDPDHNGWYKEQYPKKKAKADKLGIVSAERAKQMKELLAQYETIELTAAEKREQELKEKIKAIRGSNIPGFFPTPDEIIDVLIDAAEIANNTHFNILEPSAGMGSIVDRIASKSTQLYQCVEINHTLCEILKLKGYETEQGDIMDMKESDLMCIWERIIMNPPFEKGQDMDHVRHCYENFLVPDGILVSVMSAGVRTNSTKKYQVFRDWVDTLDHEWITHDHDFKKAFNSTGTSTIILKLRK